MKYGWLSGFLWALDTVLLGMVLSTLMPDESFRSAVWIVPLVSAWFHDLFSACWLFLLTLLSGKLGQLKKACCTRHGLVVVVAAVLGGPVGMTGYLTAIENIGSGYTACISAFYPAFGALLARVFLKEKLHPIQYAGLLIALTGVMGIGWMSAEEGESFEPMIGIFAALICVVGWGSEAVLGSYAMRHETVDNHVALQIRNAVSAAAYGVLLWGVADVGAVKPFGSILYLISGCALEYNLFCVGVASWLCPKRWRNKRTCFCILLSYCCGDDSFGHLTFTAQNPASILCTKTSISMKTEQCTQTHRQKIKSSVKH